MAYIGNPPAPQNITSSEITDGTIVNVDIASNAAIAATKIAGLATVATTGAYSDVTGTPTLATVATTGAYSDLSGTPSLVASLADLGVTASAADLNTTDVTTLGTVEASKVVTADANGDVKFPDGDKAIFGAGSDLQIYHDGSNSIIKDNGTGDLILQASDQVKIQTITGETMVSTNENNAVVLYYDNGSKLATTSTGINVTGTLEGDKISVAHAGGGDFIGVFQNTTSATPYGVHIKDAASSANGYPLFQVTNSAGSSPYLLVHSGTGNVSTANELKAGSYNETYAALSGTSPAVNCHNGNVFALSTTGNTTFTFSNPPASGTAYGFTIKVTAGGTHTLTWPSSVDWAGGTAPDAPASGETNVLVFITHDGGTTWYGFQGGAAMA